MIRYTISPLAYRDILREWVYIARDNVDAADMVEAAIYRNFDLLARNPHIGRPCLTSHSAATFTWPAWPYENYMIFYRPTTRSLRVLRVVRSERDLSKFA